MNSKEFERRLLDNWPEVNFDISKIIRAENKCLIDLTTLIMSDEHYCRET